MQDRNLSVHLVLAAALWAGGIGLIVIGLLSRSLGLGQLGLAVAGMGGVVNIRGFICQAAQRDKRMVEVFLERTAGVRSLH